jgi:hypothetical protein
MQSVCACTQVCEREKRARGREREREGERRLSKERGRDREGGQHCDAACDEQVIGTVGSPVWEGARVCACVCVCVRVRE